MENTKRYFNFGKRGKDTHIEASKTTRLIYLACGRFKFEYQLIPVEKPEAIEEICKGCRYMWDVTYA
jgi:hypothetical protein